MKPSNRKKKTLILFFNLSFIICNPLPSPAQDIAKTFIEEPASSIPEYIAIAQWSTVLKLQKLLEEKNYEKAFMCFSEKIRDRVKSFQDIDSNTMDYFFSQWSLDEKTKQFYKEKVFAGKGLFIFDEKEQEWRINEI